MKIRYFGHACFEIQGGDVTVYTDPYYGIGYELPSGLQADVVTISHNHYDHNYRGAFAGTPKFHESTEKSVYKGMSIEGLKTYHDEKKGALRGENTVFTFSADGVSVCHLGDLGEADNGEVCEFAGGVDVLCIPVGGNYTIDAAAAKAYVLKIRPQIVIPMHFSMSGGTIDIDGVESFLKLFSKEEAEILREKTLNLSACERNGSVKIVVMEKEERI
ncbi:MAG: MBL fold metallo-hydrolase [Clostridia bacterium]|nr:MBL fold metallo-hydrolase [Clostridia bacterium]